MTAYDWFLVLLVYCGIGHAILCGVIRDRDTLRHHVAVHGLRFMLELYAAMLFLWPILLLAIWEDTRKETRYYAQ